MRAFQRRKKIFYSRPVKKIDYYVKRLSFLNKIVFFFNFIFALLLLLACLVPHISAEHFAFLSVLSLTVPVLVGVNFLFFFFWILKRKRQMLLSLSVLVLGYLTMGAFVKFDFFDQTEEVAPDLRVLSYNVRNFNKNGHIDNPLIFEDIKDLVDHEDPDIVCFQEVGYSRRKEYVNYPYQYLEYIDNDGHLLLGIFSKYPIIDAQLLNFPKSFNNGAYADILYKKDTIRIYDLHLESLGITPGTGVLRSETSDKLYRRVTSRFKKQEEQAKLVREHSEKVHYKTIICGDFNNTQFSNVYHIIKGDRQDTFIEKGRGLGRTYDFLGIPLRIDFIFADSSFEVVEHKNFNFKYSDHFPVLASFNLKSD